ncbi:interferon-induced protein 44-like [Lampris incognitus]|uniref:interferon-induced protein 44-like n=1 Tax=Lampris incognitus TaxID=2546036 RepID=UPI0024B5A099|nr:interferon-induced protein 44-like [Lampris incognitus]
MSVVTSSLSTDQEEKLLSLFGHVRLHLLYKASIHGYKARGFHDRCNYQGPTVIAAYNKAGFVFGAYTSKDYSAIDCDVTDDKAFLYSITERGRGALRIASVDGEHGFKDGETGPDFGALYFLDDDKPKVLSSPGIGFMFNPSQMHGDDLDLTEFEVYRVEELGGLLAKPWRNVKWTAERKQQLMQTIQNYKPDIHSVSQAKVLLVGYVGFGKSSFFNSINSIFRGNMTCQAICGVAEKSVTNQFRTFNIKVGKGGKTLPLILCDTMGLEQTADAGLDMEDIVNIYKGHIQDRYQFNPASPLQLDAPGYKKHVTLKDVIHCVVYVVDTCSVSLFTEKVLERFATIRKKTNQLGIPQLVLMTKVDKACPLVAKDLRNVYLSDYIHKKALELSASLGIPLSCVLPVKNYSHELELDLNTDLLLLTAVDQMLNYTDSFFENQIIDEKEGLVRIIDPYNLSQPTFSNNNTRSIV